MNPTIIPATPKAEVCLPEKEGVTCKHGRAGKCAACKQAEHRKSPAHAARLERLRVARAARRTDHYHRKNRARGLGPLGYGGPVTDGVPQLGAMKLENYMKGVTR